MDTQAVKETQIQQGDVFWEASAIPEGATQVKGATFAEGEGHHVHRAAVPANVQLYEKDGIKYCRVLTETSVEHVTPDGRPGEHCPVVLAPGDYLFGQVSEYDYLNEMARSVVD